MEQAEPEPSEEPYSNSKTNKFYYFFLLFFCTQYAAQAQSKSTDSTQAKKLYEQILQKTDCAGILSPDEFYRIYYAHPDPTSTHTHTHETKQDTVYIYITDTLKGDTILLHTTDTLKGDSVSTHTHTHTTDTIKGDTVVIYQEMPSQQNVEAAKKVLQQVIEDKDLTDLIKETIANMSSDEIKEFRQELRDDVRNIDQHLRKERANRIVIELGGRRAQQKLARENQKADRVAQQAAIDTMSKTEKKELIKAKVSLIAGNTAASFEGGAQAVADGLATVGNVIAKGIVAIGKGILNSVKAIWGWLGKHFSIHIDLSCAEQRKIKKHKQTMAVLHKHRKAKPYKGSCPGW